MITKRGKRVRAIAILIGAILIWQIATNLWWVGTSAPNADFLGWCWGSMTECEVLG
jgi:hypothetical protein